MWSMIHTSTDTAIVPGSGDANAEKTQETTGAPPLGALIPVNLKDSMAGCNTQMAHRRFS